MTAKVVEGLLFPFAETGTEGHLWALQANYLGKSWSYNDLYVLEDGDELTIYNPGKEQIWSGKIQLIPNPNYLKDNIHYRPTNFDWDEWLKIFIAGNVGRDENYSNCYTAKLIRL